MTNRHLVVRKLYYRGQLVGPSIAPVLVDTQMKECMAGGIIRPRLKPTIAKSLYLRHLLEIGWLRQKEHMPG